MGCPQQLLDRQKNLSTNVRGSHGCRHHAQGGHAAESAQRHRGPGAAAARPALCGVSAKNCRKTCAPSPHSFFVNALHLLSLQRA